jgi:hypothetical protein
MISEARRRQLSRAGRLGGETLWVRHPNRVPDPTAASAAYQLSFEIAHGGNPDDYAHLRKRDRPVGLCRVCPKRIVIPAGLDDEKRERLAADQRSRHYENLAALAVASRRATG